MNKKVDNAVTELLLRSVSSVTVENAKRGTESYRQKLGKLIREELAYLGYKDSKDMNRFARSYGMSPRRLRSLLNGDYLLSRFPLTDRVELIIDAVQPNLRDSQTWLRLAQLINIEAQKKNIEVQEGV